MLKKLFFIYHCGDIKQVLRDGYTHPFRSSGIYREEDNLSLLDLYISGITTSFKDPSQHLTSLNSDVVVIKAPGGNTATLDRWVI
jgi:hypothetical protein